MSFVNDLFDRIGGTNPLYPVNRYSITGLPKLPTGFEWLTYREGDGVCVELYDPNPMVCSYNKVDSIDPDDVRACARQIYALRFP